MSSNNTVALFDWDSLDAKTVVVKDYQDKELMRHENEFTVGEICFDTTGRFLAIGSSDEESKAVTLLDVNKKEKEKKFEIEGAILEGKLYIEDSRLAALAGFKDQTYAVKIWQNVFDAEDLEGRRD